MVFAEVLPAEQWTLLGYAGAVLLLIALVSFIRWAVRVIGGR